MILNVNDLTLSNEFEEKITESMNLWQQKEKINTKNTWIHNTSTLHLPMNEF